MVRAAVGGRVDHVTVRVDNRAGLAVQVDALDASGDQVGLGEAEAKPLTSFQEIPDIGERWTRVAAYGGREAYRETLARTALVAATGRSRSRQRHQRARASGVPVNHPYPIAPEPRVQRRGGRRHPLTVIRCRSSA